MAQLQVCQGVCIHRFPLPSSPPFPWHPGCGLPKHLCREGSTWHCIHCSPKGPVQRQRSVPAHVSPTLTVYSYHSPALSTSLLSNPCKWLPTAFPLCRQHSRPPVDLHGACHVRNSREQHAWPWPKVASPLAPIALCVPPGLSSMMPCVQRRRRMLYALRVRVSRGVQAAVGSCGLTDTCVKPDLRACPRRVV